MTVTRHKRAAIMLPKIIGDGPHGVPQLLLWEMIRDECGCSSYIGLRLDNEDPTFGVDPCPLHEQENILVIHALRTMPPCDEEIAELWERLLEEAIG